MRNRLSFLCGATLLCWSFAVTFEATADQDILLAKARRDTRQPSRGEPTGTGPEKHQADERPAPAKPGDKAMTGSVPPGAPADLFTPFSAPPRPTLSGKTADEVLCATG